MFYYTYDLMTTISTSETAFVTSLAVAIEGYLAKKLPHRTPNKTFTPPNTSQSPKKLTTSYCADIITEINELSLLLLEAKISTQEGLITAYEVKQHKFLQALEALNIPIRYCYNLLPHYQGIPHEQTLSKSNTSTPISFTSVKAKSLSRKNRMLT
jgi:hypothetical protein